MRRLLSSELLRFRSRRLVVVVFVGTIIGTIVGCVIAGIESTPPTDARLAEARASARQEVANCLVTDWSEGVVTGPIEEFCEENFGNEAQYLPSHLALVDLPGILEGVASITTILGLVLGASVVAVSWQTGTIGTILTWEPRRLRWFASRLFVIAAGVCAVTLAWMAIVIAGLTVTASIRGSTIGMDAQIWREVVLTSLRIAAVAAVAALVGGGVAAIGRHTSAALAAVFVYAAVIEGLIRGFRPLWTPWLLGDNVVTVVSWRELTVQLFPTGSYTLEPIRATFVILGYAAVILAFAFTFVRIRDVQ